MDNKIKTLIAILTMLSLIILVREIFLKPPSLKIPSTEIDFPEININFELLKSFDIKDFFLIEEVVPIKKYGRENPFLEVGKEGGN